MRCEIGVNVNSTKAEPTINESDKEKGTKGVQTQETIKLYKRRIRLFQHVLIAFLDVY